MIVFVGSARNSAALEDGDGKNSARCNSEGDRR